MKTISAVEFRNRPMVVTVTEHCESCKTLKPEVKPREYVQYWPAVSIKMRCCSGCFEVAKRNAIAEAQGLIVC